ncbi:asialoglycoprotein receptor 1-like [Eublepharis macularius]|uniref:Asialoglycoprotein receptor 1-like n=1 Tax=Eublepharis macularius TaxID=481883 RepID=A0AA97K7K4_EUBMA|nr:asialoglycoprotein receptor 1-like [Eublepharis macularius]
MLRDYQDITAVDVEEESETYIRAAPTTFPLSRSWTHQFCPRRRLALILLGVGSVLAITATVLNANGSALGSRLHRMQEAFGNVNHTAAVEMAAFQSRERDTVAKTGQLEVSVKKMTEEIESARKRLLAQMAFLRVIARTVHCDLEDFQQHRTGTQVCCPPGWVSFRSNCYWDSKAGKSWENAKKDCEDKDSHLLIVNSYEEQLFVAQRVRPTFTWIGLTDASGSWKWVDGTPYTVRQEDWREEQPDNWYGHGLGGGEDCAHMHDDGRWNDDHCSREYGWVCEMEANS